MRCHICDVELSETEIQQDEEGKWEPCKTCLDIVFDTAYSDGFKPDGDGSVQELLDEEGVDA